jgi:hypothetical protein
VLQAPEPVCQWPLPLPVVIRLQAFNPDSLQPPAPHQGCAIGPLVPRPPASGLSSYQVLCLTSLQLAIVDDPSSCRVSRSATPFMITARAIRLPVHISCMAYSNPGGGSIQYQPLVGSGFRTPIAYSRRVSRSATPFMITQTYVLSWFCYSREP